MTPGQSSDPTEQLPRVALPAEGVAEQGEREAAADGGVPDEGVRADRADVATGGNGVAEGGAVGKVSARDADADGRATTDDKAGAGGRGAPDGAGRSAAGASAIVAGVKAKVSALGKVSATDKAPAKALGPGPAAAPGTGRRVRLTLSRIDPWSALKMSFLLSVAMGVAVVVAVTMLWLVFKGMGAFDQINRLLGSIIQDGDKKFDITDYVGLGRVVSLSVVFAVIDVFLVTALSTLAAYLYNVSSSLVGGLQVTLTDD